MDHADTAQLTASVRITTLLEAADVVDATARDYGDLSAAGLRAAAKELRARASRLMLEGLVKCSIVDT